SECAGGGGREDLIYISPKSGQVVSREKGAPWAEKLLLLPEFLRDDSCVESHQDILNGLKLTGYFLNQRLLAPQNKQFPSSRERLIKLLSSI
ncbi:MAG: DNA repair protein RecO C-terminal domain-containing protein, partial [Parvibaculales bacterium]